MTKPGSLDWRLEVEVNGERRGLAVLITRNLALTCAHVVSRGDGSIPDATIAVRALHGELRTAAIATGGWFPDGEDDKSVDLAIVELDEPFPLEAPARLNSTVEVGGRFRVYGAGRRQDMGLWAEGRILGPGGPRSQWFQLEGGKINPGSSGGGVTNEAGEVIGILIAADRSADSRTAWMLPLSTIAQYWPRILSLREAPVLEPQSSSVPVSWRSGEAVYPGIAADTDEGVDLLARTHDVEAMAALIAATRTTPPLSVGLFGDWGSGKSFFMRMLRAEIDALGALSRYARDNDVPTVMCGEIRQIVFNAWHYTDTNLWASLVSAIFTGLAEPRTGETKAEAEKRWNAERERLASVLESTKAQLSDAQSQSAVAGAEVERLRNELVELEKRRADERDSLAGLKPAAQAAWSDPAVRRRVETVKQHLELEQGAEIEQINQFANASVSGFRRAVRVWQLMRGSQRRRLVLMLGLMALLGITAFVAIPIVFKDSVPILTQVFGSLVALVAPLAITGVRIASRINEGLGVVESAVAAAQTAEQEAEARLEGQKQAILADLSQLDTQQAVLQKEIRHAEVRVKAAASAVDDASTGRLLATFLSERSGSTDYRSQLGMIAMIRRDFEQLTGLMELEPEGDSSVPPIERIVLYIDDLDRCPPDRVVEVLQAIHLLLGLELFVVVVAVDARWLLSSLELHFEKVLGARPKSRGDREHWSATPMNYLEKIFQIPFNLSAMDSDSYAQLVGTLFELDEPAETLRRVAHQEPSGVVVSPEPATPTGTGTPVAPVDTAGLKRLTPAGLSLTDEEKEFAQRLGPLISTPRTAKRLTNLYRLIRAGLPEEVLSGMLGSGGYEAILLSLAMLVGHPSAAIELFDKARAADDDTPWGEFVRDQPGSLGRALVEVQPHLHQLLKVSAVKPWIPVVTRYSFQIGA